jgi:hypothetical protein
MKGTTTKMPYVLTRGLGDAASDAKAVQQVGSVVTGPVVGILAAHAATVAAATGTTASIAGLSLSVAVPIIGAALVGVTMLAVYLIQNSGCGQTCIVTSQWANKAEDALRQNLAAYMALPAPRPAAAKAVALANFDAIWKTLEAQCGQPGTGNAGVRCITDRQSGACKWRDASGQCWNWFLGYRSPIEQDVPASDTATSTSGSAAGLISSLETPGSSLLPLLAMGGLVALAVSL